MAHTPTDDAKDADRSGWPRSGVTLKHRVQELIAEHGTLRGAARALQIDPGYLSRIERGEKGAPSDEVLRKMGLCRVVTFERAEGVLQ